MDIVIRSTDGRAKLLQEFLGYKAGTIVKAILYEPYHGKPVNPQIKLADGRGWYSVRIGVEVEIVEPSSDDCQYECPACGYIATQEEMDEQGEGLCPRCGHGPMHTIDPVLWV